MDSLVDAAQKNNDSVKQISYFIQQDSFQIRGLFCAEMATVDYAALA